MNRVKLTIRDYSAGFTGDFLHYYLFAYRSWFHTRSYAGCSGFFTKEKTHRFRRLPDDENYLSIRISY